MQNRTKKKSKKKVIALTSVGVLAAVGGLALYGSAMGRTSAENAKQLSTVTVEKHDLKQKVTVTGTVESKETTSVKSELAGTKFKSVKVKVGDRVKKGDVIAELDDTDLKVQLAAAQKSLDNAIAVSDISLKAAQRGYDDAVADKDTSSARGVRGINEAQNEYDKAVSDRTSAYNAYNAAVDARTAAEQTSAEAAQAAADSAGYINGLKQAVKTAKKEADSASVEFDRLALDKETTAEELETAKKSRDEARAAYDDANDALSAAQTELALLNEYAATCAQETSGAVLYEKELYAGLSSADKLVEQARLGTENAADSKNDTDREYEKVIAQNLDALDTAKLNSDDSLTAPRKQVDDISAEIEKCVIKAPCDGVVTSVSAEEGETYQGGEIAVIQDDSSYKVSASVDQYDIAKISQDMDAEISVQAIGSSPLEGKLSFVSPTPAPAALTENGAVSSTDYPIEAAFTGEEKDLRIGMSAKLVIVTDEKKDVLAVPDNYIQKDDNGWFVTVRGEGTEKDTIYVEKGLETDYYTEISGNGISEGMELIAPETDNDKAASVFF